MGPRKTVPFPCAKPLSPRALAVRMGCRRPPRADPQTVVVRLARHIHFRITIWHPRPIRASHGMSPVPLPRRQPCSDAVLISKSQQWELLMKSGTRTRVPLTIPLRASSATRPRLSARAPMPRLGLQHPRRRPSRRWARLATLPMYQSRRRSQALEAYAVKAGSRA